MSEHRSDDAESEPQDEPRAARSERRSRALIITAAVLVVAFLGLTAFASFWTERLWFQSVGYSGGLQHAALDPGRAVPRLRRR